MVLDASGFPKKSEIFPGNINEPKTLEHMLTVLQGNRDASIVTEDNIAWLQKSGYHYIVVIRKRNKEKEDNNVQAVLIKNEETAELELYCHSEAKGAKAKYMVSKTASRYTVSASSGITTTPVSAVSTTATTRGWTRKGSSGRIFRRF